jgi:hypothetical protein
MIEEPVLLHYDVSLNSIEGGIVALRKHFPKGRVFFIAFTSQHRVFSRPTDVSLAHGYDAVFFQPNDDLPNQCAWDLVMYDNKTGLPLARLQHRPS